MMIGRIEVLIKYPTSCLFDENLTSGVIRIVNRPAQGEACMSEM